MTAATQFIVAVVIMFVYSPLMGALFLLTVPLYALLMRYSSRRVAPTIEALEEEYGRFRSRQIDGIRGIATVKAMGREDGIRARARREPARSSRTACSARSSR